MAGAGPCVLHRCRPALNVTCWSFAAVARYLASSHSPSSCKAESPFVAYLVLCHPPGAAIYDERSAFSRGRHRRCTATKTSSLPSVYKVLIVSLEKMDHFLSQLFDILLITSQNPVTYSSINRYHLLYLRRGFEPLTFPFSASLISSSCISCAVLVL